LGVGPSFDLSRFFEKFGSWGRPVTAHALIDDAEQWRRAEILRAYVRAASEALEVKEDWKTWALAAADELDPLVELARNEA
jgi:hypothetical protein